MAAPRTHAKPAFLTGKPRVQTQWVWGPYERRRWAIFAAKFGIFLGLPWLMVGGAPALLFDIPRRQYHVFGQIFWPQDFYMLGLVLAVCAVLLFTTTALVGRVFCGNACPHTLMTSLFMLVDHLIEGDRPARLKLDGTPGLHPRRVLKHVVWLAIAGWLGFTFTSYFVGAHELLARVAEGRLGGAPLVTWAAISFAVYLFAGHLRDFICTTTCPYGRFQGAMGDPDSLVVAYDAERGDPRGKTKDVIARGGCVDCGMCVTACPMGIDIRNGLQYECITCARCIDACNLTMSKLGQAPDLIRFAATHGRLAAGTPTPLEAPAAAAAAAPVAVAASAGATSAENPDAPRPPVRQNRLWRPRARLGWYGVVLTGLVAAIATLVATRPMLGLEIVRDRQPALRLADGRAANLYALKLLNKDTRPRRLAVELTDAEGQLLLGENPFTLAPGEIREVKASVVFPDRVSLAPRPFRFRLVEPDGGTVRDEAAATFVQPAKIGG